MARSQCDPDTPPCLALSELTSTHTCTTSKNPKIHLNYF